MVALVDRIKPDVIALDLRMPGADGVEIIRELGNRKCQSSIILMSGMDQRTLSSVQTLGREHHLDIGSTLTKPMSIDAIENALRPFVSGIRPKLGKPQLQKASAFDYGLTVLYEPERVSKPLPGDDIPRLRVVPQWRDDKGNYLCEEQLQEWASKTGIIKGLSRIVLDSALETLRVWGNQGFSPQIAFRLNSGILRELDMPDILAELVDGYSVPREFVTIEVDEEAITHKQNCIVDVLSRLRIKGFKTAICIARKGEEVLQEIDRLPVDAVILDMNYLSRRPDFLHNMETEFLYSSMTSIINHKGITTCAANVDSDDVVTFLQRCDFNSVRGTQIQAPVRAGYILPLYMEGDFGAGALDTGTKALP